MDPVKEITEKELYENLESYYKLNAKSKNNCFKEFIKDISLIVIPLVLVIGGIILLCFII